MYMYIYIYLYTHSHKATKNVEANASGLMCKFTIFCAF